MQVLILLATMDDKMALQTNPNRAFPSSLWDTTSISAASSFAQDCLQANSFWTDSQGSNRGDVLVLLDVLLGAHARVLGLRPDLQSPLEGTKCLPCAWSASNGMHAKMLQPQTKPTLHKTSSNALQW